MRTPADERSVDAGLNRVSACADRAADSFTRGTGQFYWAKAGKVKNLTFRIQKNLNFRFLKFRSNKKNADQVEQIKSFE